MFPGTVVAAGPGPSLGNHGHNDQKIRFSNYAIYQQCDLGQSLTFLSLSKVSGQEEATDHGLEESCLFHRQGAPSWAGVTFLSPTFLLPKKGKIIRSHTYLRGLRKLIFENAEQ